MKFEFVIHPQKSGVNFAFRDLCNMAVFSAMVVIPAFPIQRPAACFFSKSCTAEATVYFSVKCIIKSFIHNEMLLGVCMVMIATPVASMTAMLAQQYDGDYELASRSVALTTILSVVTMPLVSVIVGI